MLKLLRIKDATNKLPLKIQKLEYLIQIAPQAFLMPPPLLGIYRPDSVTLPSPDTSVKKAEKKLKILKTVLDSNGRPRRCHVLRSWRNVSLTCSKTRFPLIIEKYKIRFACLISRPRFRTFIKGHLNKFKLKIIVCYRF